MAIDDCKSDNTIMFCHFNRSSSCSLTDNWLKLAIICYQPNMHKKYFYTDHLPCFHGDLNKHSHNPLSHHCSTLESIKRSHSSLSHIFFIFIYSLSSHLLPLPHILSFSSLLSTRCTSQTQSLQQHSPFWV